ncbi:flagellin [Sinorhizobium meliloti]|uniref:flagellin n=1 Tax=Rhizobium meliloti TaxID=382 RepID=UPI00299EF0B8|nr:flagellin [Sinorhizobium meliloti]MDW9695038.1 flagellin [Sinorhizobium meliloti]MDW9719857.1 flagellin [Sinorhizobium meliloti]MDW9757111.1 flagellin [Sinorhizobium meliloti]
MTSILTNVAAMAALQTLRGIDSNMEETQARVSSGLRVGTASDNAAYWSIATTMRSDNMALSAVQDALGLGAAKVDTAYAGMENAVEVVKEIRAKLVAATEDGVDKAKIQEEIEQLKQQLTSIATAASFSGENWLQADITTPVTKSLVGSFVRDSSGVVSVKTIDYVLDGNSVLFDTVGDAGILDKIYNVSQASVTLPVNVNGTTTEYTVAAYAVDELIAAGATFDGDSANVTGYTVPAGGIDYNGNFVKVEGTWVRAIDVAATGQEVVYDDGTTKWGVDTTVAGAPAINVVAPASIENIDITNAAQAANLDALIRGVDEALEDLISATSALGSISMRIGMQEEFVSKLTDSIDSGIGRLVDADMNEESTRLKALQTQQQLAIQSLSIANTNSENILQLFRQ